MKNFTPEQVRDMSLAEANAALDGFQELNGSKRDDVPTMEEVEEMMRLYPDN